MIIKPDFERIKTAAKLGKSDIVPLLEVLVDLPIQSTFLGKEVTGDDLASQVEFWTSAGYDYIPLTAGMMNPGKVTQDSFISKVLKDYVADGSVEDSWNVEMNDFIRTREDFEKFPWEVLEKLDFDKVIKVAPMLPEKMKVVVTSGKVFTLSWMLMGFNNFCSSLILDEQLVADVVEKVAKIQIACVDAVLEMPHVGGVWFVDDIAFGTGAMLSPDAFRKHIFPWYKELTKRCHKRDLVVFFHTDGVLTGLMDDIIDMGIDVLQPIDPTCMDIVEVKKRWGDRICIAGNVPNEMLQFASPKQIEDYVKYLIENVAPGGGYMLGSGNSVAEWSKFENFMAMRAANFKFGRY